MRPRFALVWGAALLGLFAGASEGGDVCRRLCEGPLAAKYSKSECERGCRLFNIAMGTNPPPSEAADLTATKDQCHRSCREAYDETSRVHCYAGCTEMLNLQKETWLYFERRGEGDGVLEVEVSLVSDPAFWEQTLGSDGNYKMPQAYIRTMPLQNDLTGVEALDARYNWSPCGGPQAGPGGIPLWVVAAFAIALTLFTLYTLFALRPSVSYFGCFEGVDVPAGATGAIGDDYDEDSDEESSAQQQQQKDGPDYARYKKALAAVDHLDLMTLDEFLHGGAAPAAAGVDYHANVVPPPKYSPYPTACEA